MSTEWSLVENWKFCKEIINNYLKATEINKKSCSVCTDTAVYWCGEVVHLYIIRI